MAYIRVVPSSNRILYYSRSNQTPKIQMLPSLVQCLNICKERLSFPNEIVGELMKGRANFRKCQSCRNEANL
jgi:hypothetical protein